MSQPLMCCTARDSAELVDTRPGASGSDGWFAGPADTGGHLTGCSKLQVVAARTCHIAVCASTSVLALAKGGTSRGCTIDFPDFTRTKLVFLAPTVSQSHRLQPVPRHHAAVGNTLPVVSAGGGNFKII